MRTDWGLGMEIRMSNLELQALTKEHCNEKFTRSFIKNCKLKKNLRLFKVDYKKEALLICILIIQYHAT